MEIPWVSDLDVLCNVLRVANEPCGDSITLTLRQALLTTETGSNWACPLFLAVECVQVEDKWWVCALCNASDAALDTEAVTIATHIHTLLQAHFGTKAVETWFLTEAETAAETVTWNSSQQCVKSLSKETQDEIDAPSHGFNTELQAWEILDGFDALDGAHPHQQPVFFELANHFSLAPNNDFTSLQDAGSTKSFTLE